MSRAARLETENDNQFHELAGKISTFKNIANEINGYAQEDTATLNNLSGTMTRLQDSVRHGAYRLKRVINSNPKLSKMVAIGIALFIVVYVTFTHIL